ncbi:MAG: hypothetical protein ACREEM_19915 [Blastocatellia bacterium]
MKLENIGKDEGFIEITEEDYLEDLSSGLSEDQVMKPGRHKFIRGGFLKRHPNFDPATVKTTIYVQLGLDQEVLEYFKQLAKETNAESYETLIKQSLRETMERGRQEKVDAKPDPQAALIADPRFIQAVAERVKKTLSKKSATKSAATAKQRRRTV